MATGLTMMAAPAAQARRERREPTHSFNLQFRPYQIQPCFIAPVLPGESMTQLLLQNRCVSMPIKNPLIGWWLEHYVYYVKLSDLYQRELMMDMLLRPDASISGLDDATAVKYYHTNGTGLAPNWAQKCTQVIVEHHFRNAGELAGDYTLNGMYAASVNINNWTDSAVNEGQLIQAAGVDQNLVSTTGGQGDATTGVWTSEIDKAMREYQFARMNKVTEMTFEDWCRQFGVAIPNEAQPFKPELVRYSKEWTYPTNTIEPSTGAPSSAVSWATALKADQRRYFREPGFLIGFVVARPKIYFGNLNTAAVMLMRDAYSWLPATLAADPYSSFVKVAASDPPLDANTDAYFVDLKDLLLYGDQFVNYAMNTAGFNHVALPNAALTNKRYASVADVDNLFVDTTTGVGMLRCDGVAQLSILGRQTETSPQGVGGGDTLT